MTEDFKRDITEANLANLTDMQKAILFCDRIMNGVYDPNLQSKILNYCGIHALMIKEIISKHLEETGQP